MAQKKVWLDNERFHVCDVTYGDTYDTYDGHFQSEERLKEVLAAMRNNGMEARRVNNCIRVNRHFRYFRNQCYYLHQCNDLIEWIQESKVGQFTYYYDKVVFHTADGVYAAYDQDINNYWKI